MGRKREHKEPMVIATFNVTADQKNWIAEESARRDVYESDLIRELIERERKKTGSGESNPNPSAGSPGRSGS